jgi:hypothetical protein
VGAEILIKIAQRLPCSGAGGHVATRGNAELPDESPRQMALVGKARIECGLDYGPTAGQQPVRQMDAPLNQIGMRRCAYLPYESPQQLEAEPGELCKLAQSCG